MLMEIAVSLVLIHLLGLHRGDRDVAEISRSWPWRCRARTTDGRGLIGFICGVSICCVHVKSVLLYKLLIVWKRPGGLRQISEKVKLGMELQLSKADWE